jgi:hypothetical protein
MELLLVGQFIQSDGEAPRSSDFFVECPR